MSVIIAAVLATVLVILGIWVAHKHSQGFRFIQAEGHYLLSTKEIDSLLYHVGKIRHGVEASGSLSQLAKDRPKVVRKTDMRVGRLIEGVEKIQQRAPVQ